MCLILVVDDEPAVRRLLKVVLSETGCEVVLAPSGEAALELLQDTAPDVVLADVQLPDIDGVELARQIRGDTRLGRSHVILMSAYERPRNLHGEPFIPKPFDFETLISMVRSQTAS